MKRQHIRTGREGEFRAQTVQKSVSDFMRNDVVGEAGVKTASRQVIADRLPLVAFVVARPFAGEISCRIRRVSDRCDESRGSVNNS